MPRCNDTEVDWETTSEIVKPIIGITDPFIRNKKITHAYAQLFLDSIQQDAAPQYWAAAAAFTSKQLGCRMREFRTNILGLVTPLGEANRNVFEKLYPMFRFFVEHRRCSMRELCALEPPGAKVTHNALEAALANLASNHGDDRRDAALRILNVEQSETLMDFWNKGLVYYLTWFWRAGQHVDICSGCNCPGPYRVDPGWVHIALPDVRIRLGTELVDRICSLLAADPAHLQRELANCPTDY